jgi:hypothetical protein
MGLRGMSSPSRRLAPPVSQAHAACQRELTQTYLNLVSLLQHAGCQLWVLGCTRLRGLAVGSTCL